MEETMIVKHDSPFPAVETIAKKKDVTLIATGHEKEEPSYEGMKLFDINFPEGHLGTKGAPAIVKSYYDKPIVGCSGGEGCAVPRHAPSSPAYYMTANDQFERVLRDHRDRHTYDWIVNDFGMPSQAYKWADTVALWDIENCQVPQGCCPFSVRRRIVRTLRQQGYEGRVDITAVAANRDRVTFRVRRALWATGITFKHLNTELKQASDDEIIRRAGVLVNETPAPANLLLISGDLDFANVLMDLERLYYNTILAYIPESTSNLMGYLGYWHFEWTELLQW